MILSGSDLPDFRFIVSSKLPKEILGMISCEIQFKSNQCRPLKQISYPQFG